VFILLTWAMPLLLILSWLVLRFAARSKYVPAWFFKLWLGLIVAAAVAVAALYVSGTASSSPDLSRGLLTVLLLVNAVISAFVFAVLLVLPRGRPEAIASASKSG